ncbi:GDSL-type esterase/lipase family protein [Ningiella sp. W23]|uniref:GDSL-type esterase/lipase family protein n=1 Tax=Ningiella sp. W23 TaxID=3023715 RepID=UPI003756F6D3
MKHTQIRLFLLALAYSLFMASTFATSQESEQIEQIEQENNLENEPTKELPMSLQPMVHTAEWAVDWWLPRHQQKLAELEQRNFDIDLVFLGDSITHNWESKGKEHWQTFYAERKALNLGFGGDRTEHVLWRLQNNAIDGIDPKLLVLLIGTNNTGHRQDPADETALGIRAILDELVTRLPNTKILMLAVFPRGETASDPLRILNTQVNKQIQKFADNNSIFWLNINHMFLTEDGVLPKSVMNDFLHPESEQYRRWALAIEPYVKRFVDNAPKPTDAEPKDIR